MLRMTRVMVEGLSLERGNKTAPWSITPEGNNQRDDLLLALLVDVQVVVVIQDGLASALCSPGSWAEIRVSPPLVLS